MTTKFEQDKQAVADAAQIEKNRALLTQWLGKHPFVPDCIAVRKLFEEYADFTDDLTESDLDFMYGNLESQIGKQRVPTEPEQREELIEQICSLIASANNGRDGKYDEFNLKSERTRMSHWTIPQLTNRLEEVMRKQTLVVKTTSELKQIVAEAHTDTRKYPGFPTLGKTIVRPGTVRPVPLDAAYLKSLDSWDLKRFVRTYSAAQINDRLAGRS
jgi:hypothetical protein